MATSEKYSREYIRNGGELNHQDLHFFQENNHFVGAPVDLTIDIDLYTSSYLGCDPRIGGGYHPSFASIWWDRFTMFHKFLKSCFGL